MAQAPLDARARGHGYVGVGEQSVYADAGVGVDELVKDLGDA